MDPNDLKTVDLHFTIPVSVDTPSETLLRMRDLCCRALDSLLNAGDRGEEDLTTEECGLIVTMLTES
jgi:hypothetical protein